MAAPQAPILVHRPSRSVAHALTLLLLALGTIAPIGAAQAQTGIQFDGVNDYVTFGQATSTLGTPTFTIEVWFKRTGAGVVTSTGSGTNAANGLTNVVPLLAKGRGQADGSTVDCNYFLGIQNTPNVVLVADYEDFASSNNNHALTGSTVIRNNVWYHAAATYDGLTFRLYLNGNLEASAATTAQPRFDSIQHASLGTAIDAIPAAAGFFQGVLDEARVWDHARSQADIRDGATTEVSSATGLLGRWGLNDGSGTNAANSVGGSPSGTLTNFSGTVWVAGGPFAYAYGLALNGSSGYATFGDPSALDLPAFTVETWFRRDGAGTTTTTGTGGIPDALPLVTHGAPEAEAGTVDMNFFLGLTAAGRICADFEEGAGGASPGQNHPITGTTAVTNGVWHHAAATYDGTTWNLYLDGLLEATATIGQPVQSSTTQHAALGTALTTAGATNGFFAGVLDEARVWSGARSQSQIQATINSQLTSPTAGLVARWGLDEGAGRVVRDTSGSAVHGTLNPASPSSAWGWLDGAPFNAVFTPPSAPTGLTATAITHARIDLAWTDNATDESSFEIERSTTGIGGSYSFLASVPANTQAYSDLTVGASSEYCYRVRAVNGAGPSGYADPSCATTPAFAGSALDFGGNTYASFGDPASLRLSQFTIELWIRRDGAGVGTDTGAGGIPDAIPLVTKGRADVEDPTRDINYFFGIKAATGALCADFEEGAGGAGPVSLNHPILGTTSIAAGSGWHHVAATYDGTTWKLYLDGFEEASLVVGQPLGSASNVPVAIGTALRLDLSASGFFDGVMDEVRIWNLARTPGQIQAAANSQLSAPQTGLVARWALDENGGTAINGTAGTTVNGSITGASYTWVGPAPFNLSFTPPAAPENFNASAISNAQIDLGWTDLSSNETGFEIERSTTGIGGTYSPLVTIGPNSTTYSDLGLSASTEYCYRVRAVNGGGPSAYAGPDCATTTSAPVTALDFAGGTYVSFGDPAVLDLAQFTVECWFRRDGAGTTTSTGSGGVTDAIPLVTKGASQADGSNVDMNYFLGIRNSDGVLCADFEEGAAGTTPGLNHPVTGVTPVGSGVWHHAAVTYDGTTWRLYLDGMLEATLAVGQPPRFDSIQPAALASSLTSTATAQGFFDGVLDEARIWNVVRSQALIQSTANAQITTAQAGLVARWGLDEGTGTAVSGSAGTTVNGTISGTNFTWVAPAPFNLSFNMPPDPPTLIVPPNNATDVSTGPSLYVTASDPEAGNLTVTWYGRPVTSNVGPDFTLIGMPDTQYYTGQLNGGTSAIFKSQTSWIAANRAGMNTAYVATLGDCVEHGDAGDGISPNPAIEWMRADTAYSYIEDPITTGLPEGIPYGVTVGNHDQSPIGNPDGTTTYYNQYFGTARFQGRSYYGGHYGSNNDNWYDLFSASGMDFIVISFEYDTTPDQAVLDWADALLTTHSNRRAIALTHHMINTGNPGTFSTQGQAIYNALRDHANLFLLLGGHVPGEGRRQDTFNGNTVLSMLCDYQSRTNGGNGWLRIMTFSPANNTIAVQTYSPWLSQFETDGDSQFTLSYNMSNSAPFQLIGSDANVPSGSSTAMVWSGLSPNTQYEWYATVSDGAVTTTGPTWAFTTSSTVGVEDMVPSEIALGPLRPNPSFGRVEVSFALPRPTPARLSLFDLQGREVAVLADGILSAGRHPIAWDGKTRNGTLRPGLYLLRLQTPGRVDVRKMVWSR